MVHGSIVTTIVRSLTENVCVQVVDGVTVSSQSEVNSRFSRSVVTCVQVCSRPSGSQVRMRSSGVRVRPRVFDSEILVGTSESEVRWGNLGPGSG